MIRSSLCILMIVALFASVGFASELTDSLKAGKAGSMTLLADPAKMEPSDKPGRNPAGPINANPRIDTVTDMAYLEGKVIVAGLSNEEFNSDLRTIPLLDIKGVWQISKLDDGHALMLVDSRGKVAFVPGNATAQAPAPGGSLDLVTVVLP